MKNNTLIRQLKLHALVKGKVPPNENVSQIINFFNDLFTGMEISYIPEYCKFSIIFHKGTKYYMEMDFVNGYLFCAVEDFWNHFRNKGFISNFDQTQELIRIMVGLHLNRAICNPTGTQATQSNTVEIYLAEKTEPSSPYDPNVICRLEKSFKEYIEQINDIPYFAHRATRY